MSRVLAWGAALMTSLCALGWWISDAAEIEYWLPHSRSDSLTVHAYIHSERPADVLCIGSSRTQSGLPSLLLESLLERDGADPVRVYNLGQQAAYVPTQDIVLRDVVTADRRTDLVLLEVGTCVLNSESDDLSVCLEFFASPRDSLRLAGDLRSMNDVFTVFATMFRGVTTTMERVVSGPDDADVRARLDAIQRQQGGRISPISEGDSGSLAGMSGPERERRWRTLAKRIRRQRLRRYRIEGAADEALRRSVAHCRELGVEIVFLVVPTSEKFRDVFRKGEDAIFGEYVRAVAAELDVPLIDPRAAGVSFDDGDFRDHHHLNDRGAEKLCRHLVDGFLRARLAR